MREILIMLLAANSALALDGDAAFYKVENRRAAHQLEPGTAAAAVNQRFDEGKPRARYGVGMEQWGVPHYGGLVPLDAHYISVPDFLAVFEVTGLTVGQRYRALFREATFLAYTFDSYAADATPAQVILSASGTFVAEFANVYFYAPYTGSVMDVHAQIYAVPGRTCGYGRFNDPNGVDNGVLLTDEIRASDGGRGKAWRIYPGNVPQEIPLNGHDVWGTARLIQCDNQLVLLRHGWERHYFDDAAVNAGTDRVTLNTEPNWNNGDEVVVRADSTDADWPGGPVLGGTYYVRKVSGSAELMELYATQAQALALSATTGRLDLPAPESGRFYVERRALNPGFYGNNAPQLVMVASDTETAFEVGFEAVLVDYEVTNSSADQDTITVFGHGLQAGTRVTMTLSTDGALDKYVFPLSDHTLRLYDTQINALANAGAKVSITDTVLGTDVFTSVAHGLTTGEPVTLSAGITGLTAGTTKWVNRIDADTFYLYDTSENAITGGVTGRFDITADDETATVFRFGLFNVTADSQTASDFKRVGASGLPLPGGNEGVYTQGRLLILNGKNLLISDPLDIRHFTPFVGTIATNQAESGYPAALVVGGNQEILILTEHGAQEFLNLAGGVGEWVLRDVTREYGCLAPLTALRVGTDSWFLSRRGIASVAVTQFGQQQGVALPVSHDIARRFESVDWRYARQACGAQWNNRVFFSVPLKGQTVAEGESATNNGTLVFNTLNQGWEDLWQGDFLLPYAFSQLTIAGEERLTFATPDGLVCWLTDGFEDFHGAITTDLLTRGYFGGQRVQGFKAELNWDSWNPSVTVSIVSAGQGESVDLAPNPITYDRTRYVVNVPPVYGPELIPPGAQHTGAGVRYIANTTEGSTYLYVAGMNEISAENNGVAVASGESFVAGAFQFEINGNALGALVTASVRQVLTPANPPYDPDTSTTAQFDAPHREDYSPGAGELFVARLDAHQNLTERFRFRVRDRALQVRVVNTQGSLQLNSVELAGRPIGGPAAKET